MPQPQRSQPSSPKKAPKPTAREARPRTVLGEKNLNIPLSVRGLRERPSGGRGFAAAQRGGIAAKSRPKRKGGGTLEGYARETSEVELAPLLGSLVVEETARELQARTYQDSPAPTASKRFTPCAQFEVSDEGQGIPDVVGSRSRGMD